MNVANKKYDCIVVGSGPGGSPFAWKLAANGMNVLLVEAGPSYDPFKDYALNEEDWELKRFPYRKKIKHTYGENQKLDPQYDQLRSWNKASGNFNKKNVRIYNSYQQVCGVGGTTLHFQGEAHRFNQNSFRMKTLYGVAADWPISYKDLEPYYTEAERIIGVAGP